MQENLEAFDLFIIHDLSDQPQSPHHIGIGEFPTIALPKGAKRQVMEEVGPTTTPKIVVGT